MSHTQGTSRLIAQACGLCDVCNEVWVPHGSWWGRGGRVLQEPSGGTSIFSHLLSLSFVGVMRLRDWQLAGLSSSSPVLNSQSGETQVAFFPHIMPLVRCFFKETHHWPPFHRFVSWQTKDVRLFIASTQLFVWSKLTFGVSLSRNSTESTLTSDPCTSLASENLG